MLAIGKALGAPLRASVSIAPINTSFHINPQEAFDGVVNFISLPAIHHSEKGEAVNCKGKADTAKLKCAGFSTHCTWSPFPTPCSRTSYFGG